MIYNPYIVVPAATWAVAQLAKFALGAFRGRVDFRYLYSSGGMPSVHSAVVCSLATTALLVDGAGSHLFGFALIFAAIVMYDSFGVRRSSGEQAAAINMLIESLDRGKIRITTPALHLREILGHQPEEVTIGAVTGVLLGALFNYNHLGSLGAFLEGTAHSAEMIVYLAIGVGLVAAGIIQRLTLGRRPWQALRQVSRQVFTATQTTGWLVLVATVLIYERASYLGWRLWVLVILMAAAVWLAVLAAHWRGRLPKAIEQEQDAARKSKWLNFGRRRKRG